MSNQTVSAIIKFKNFRFRSNRYHPKFQPVSNPYWRLKNLGRIILPHKLFQKHGITYGGDTYNITTIKMFHSSEIFHQELGTIFFPPILDPKSPETVSKNTWNDQILAFERSMSYNSVVQTSYASLELGRLHKSFGCWK